MKKRKVILITDGDSIAQQAVEEAVKSIGGRCISKSAGNPTPRPGSELVELIKQTPHDPVVVMVDDRGHTGMGRGEEAMDYILNSKDLEVMGVIAVASNTKQVNGIRIDCSVDKKGKITGYAVDKSGNIKSDKIIKGDTVDVLNDINVPMIVGVGDPGKMDGCDSIEVGAPIITRAMEEIISRFEKENPTTK
jgi:stage V sporulation protein AE